MGHDCPCPTRRHPQLAIRCLLPRCMKSPLSAGRTGGGSETNRGWPSVPRAQVRLGNACKHTRKGPCMRGSSAESDAQLRKPSLSRCSEVAMTYMVVNHLRAGGGREDKGWGLGARFSRGIWATSASRPHERKRADSCPNGQQHVAEGRRACGHAGQSSIGGQRAVKGRASRTSSDHGRHTRHGCMCAGTRWCRPQAEEL